MFLFLSPPSLSFSKNQVNKCFLKIMFVLGIFCKGNVRHFKKYRATLVGIADGNVKWYTCYRKSFGPWPVWLSWLEHHPVTERLWVQFPHRAHTYLHLWVDPQSELVWEATNPCFSLASVFLSLPSSLSKSSE